MLRPSAQLAITVASVVILPLSTWIFGVGFFPHKPLIPGRDHAPNAALKYTPVAPFDKLIFMVVDALRRYS